MRRCSRSKPARCWRCGGRPPATERDGFLPPLAVGSAQLLRLGTDRNYLFLAWTSGAMLVVDHLRRILDSRWRWLLAAVALHACAIPSLYLVAPDRIGRIGVVTAYEQLS